MSETTITVFGSSRPAPGDALYYQAYVLGAAIASSGWILVNGGYGGTMEASAAGARSEDGMTIGVTCEGFDREDPNPHIDRVVHTRDLGERLARLIDEADGYVVLPGGIGDRKSVV